MDLVNSALNHRRFARAQIATATAASGTLRLRFGFARKVKETSFDVHRPSHHQQSQTEKACARDEQIRLYAFTECCGNETYPEKRQNRTGSHHPTTEP